VHWLLNGKSFKSSIYRGNLNKFTVVVTSDWGKGETNAKTNIVRPT